VGVRKESRGFEIIRAAQRFPYKSRICIICIIFLDGASFLQDDSEMSHLRIEDWEMPAGDLGRLNPLPSLQLPKGPHGRQADVEEAIDSEEARYVRCGHVRGCLPYAKMYGYGRELRPRRFRTAVLENDCLRATFLLELGGRLWSLVHKPTNTELLYVNPVFQPANLGTVEVWFSGGVEWNCGVRGHTPLTCSPMWAARVTGDGGQPVLRLYEWERIRCLPYQMDFMLPDGSPWLLARMRVINPHDVETPMYWWSNIAVPELAGARVVVPATENVRFSYTGEVSLRAVPVHEGRDESYPTQLQNAGDFFYRVNTPERPWIASLQRDGRGLVQASTPRLRGRKLFRWGMSPGGRNWQAYLTSGGLPYIEIQAGLAVTQAQCLPMPPRTDWEWLEAYGLMEADPAVVHGDDWNAAVSEVNDRLDATCSAQHLAEVFEATAGLPHREPEELLHRGSGWGALERHRRTRSGEPAADPAGLRFDDTSLGEAQHPWKTLLESGAFPESDPTDVPVSWMVQPAWRELLERAIEKGSGHWAAWLHLGVMKWYAGDTSGAAAAWRTSMERTPSAWACRNLARLAADEQRWGEAAELFDRARAMQPGLLPLAVEWGQTLLKAGQASRLLRQLDDLPPGVREARRMRLLEAQAALEAGDPSRADTILAEERLVDDIREGEVSLSDLWFGVQEKLIAAREGVAIDEAFRQRVRREIRPPRHLDFRMWA
jgi:hypothetical protein